MRLTSFVCKDWLSWMPSYRIFIEKRYRTSGWFYSYLW